MKVTGNKKFGTEGFASSGSEFPQGLHDYTGSAPDGPIYTEVNKYGQIGACTNSKPVQKDGNEPIATITARRLIWEIRGSN